MDNENPLTFEKLKEAMNKIPKLEPEENLLSIVITKYAPETELGKCQLEKGFHIIVRKRIWKTQILPLFEMNQSKGYYATSFSSFMGVPIYEDDEMGLSIIIQTKEYQVSVTEKYNEWMRVYLKQIQN